MNLRLKHSLHQLILRGD
jgi:hypothetical protein